LSIWHPLADRLLGRHPWILGVDLALVAAFLAFSGGSASPYTLYAYIPLLAASFFFGIKGGLNAALALTAFYLITLFALPPAPRFSIADALSQILAFFLIALMFGYPAVLLRRLKEANDELQRAQEDVQRATTLAALGKTIAHVSHEIRNPLVTLGGFARQLMRNPGDDKTVRHHAQIMATEITRLETLLTDVLAVARPPKLKLMRGNLHEVLDQACLLASGAGRMTIEKDYDPSLPWLRMNAPALLRAFLNIARNAAQAMPEGGTLKITTRYASDRELAEITFTDSGPGIPDEILATLFEPFVTHRENGTGLGLAIAHQIAHEHSGTIRAGNAANGGAQFTVYLPLLPKETE
jgi:signal transduction histidine kinase